MTDLECDIARMLCCPGTCAVAGTRFACVMESYSPRARAIISRVLDACEPVTEEMKEGWRTAGCASNLQWSAMLAAKHRELMGDGG